MIQCPAQDELRLFLLGESPRPLHIADHLAGCASCRARIRALSPNSSSDPFAQPTNAEPAGTDSMATPGPSASALLASLHDYEILHEIHRGGQGIVYKAIQKSTGRTVAVKVLLSGMAATEEQRHRFEREINLAASIHHPGIVTIFESGLTEQRYFYAMEYVSGQTLDAWVVHQSPSLHTRLHTFVRICEAVASAHAKGVIHRDLKPGNILVDSENHPHILDFGLAKPAANVTVPVTLTTQFMGTLAYSSPEQTRGNQSYIDARTDVYSLGVILYEMLARRLPYVLTGGFVQAAHAICTVQPDPPSDHNPELSSDLDTIILRALAKDPARRYQSVGELAQDIRHSLEGRPISARRDSIVYVARLKARTGISRHRRMARVMIALWTATVMFFIGGAILRLMPGPERAFERWARAMVPPATGAPTLSRIHVIAITERAKADFPAIAKSLGIPNVTAEFPKSHRALHGHLMSRLAAAGVRVVAWDIVFPTVSQADLHDLAPPGATLPGPDQISAWSQAFADGARAVSMAGGVVVVSVENWPSDPPITPDTDPIILNAPVRWGAVTQDEGDWRSDILIVRDATTSIFSLPLAAFAAMSHPRMAVRAQVDAATRDLLLVYSDPMQSLQQTSAAIIDRVQISQWENAESGDLQYGILPTDSIGRLVIQLPDESARLAATSNYHEVLSLSDSELARRFGNTLVLVADFTNTDDIRPAPDGRMLHGVYGHAAAISAMLHDRTSVFFPGRFSWFLLLLLGAGIGVIIAHRLFGSVMVAASAMLFAAVGLVVASLLMFRTMQLLWNPLLPCISLVLAAWLAYLMVPDKPHASLYDT